MRYIDFTTDGTQLITSPFGVVRFWDVATHEEAGEPIDVSPDGQLLVTGSQQRLRLWDKRTLEQVGDAEVFDAPQQITAVAFSPDGDTVAVGMADGKTSLWDVAQHASMANCPARRTRAPCRGSYVWPTGRRTIRSSPRAPTCNCGTPTRRRLDQILDNPSGLAFSPDGRTVATGAREKGTVWLYLL